MGIVVSLFPLRSCLSTFSPEISHQTIFDIARAAAGFAAGNCFYPLFFSPLLPYPQNSIKKKTFHFFFLILRFKFPLLLCYCSF